MKHYVKESVKWVRLDDGAIIVYDLSRNQGFELAPGLPATLWHMIVEGRSFSEICSDIQQLDETNSIEHDEIIALAESVLTMFCELNVVGLAPLRG